MYEKMTAMILENDTCVMATVGANRPHCSLMVYVADETGKTIYLATARDSRKFRNLEKNPFVSLLIDTRNSPKRDMTRALTVSGTCAPVRDPERKSAAQTRLRSVHPQLAVLLDRPDAEILCIRVESFLLLNGVSDAQFVEVEQPAPDL